MDQSEPPVRLQPPPRAVVRVVNPVVRRLLTSPLGSRLPATLHLLEFTGRRSGRRFSVPVGVHEVAGGPVAFTEAAWRSNFAGGRELLVRRGRSVRRGSGELVSDAEVVADALAQALAAVGPQGLGLRTAPGHVVTRDDLVRLGRGLVRLRLDG